MRKLGVLKENKSGYWSHRIDKENRFIDHYQDNQLVIISAKYHFYPLNIIGNVMLYQKL